MNRWLLIAVAMAAAGDAMAQSGATQSVRSESVRSQSPTSPEGVTDAVAEEAVRRAIWHSTEMLDARAYVLDYCQRLKHSSRTDGERYLRRVSQLSSSDMLEWLRRLQQQRDSLEGRRQAEERARELSVGLAAERLRQMEEAGFKAGQTKAEMTEAWRQRAELAAASAGSMRARLSGQAPA